MRPLLAVLLALFAFAALTFGQATDANLVGSVVDASGAAVTNGVITIENIATGVKTGTIANREGQYRFNNIPIGIYNVSVTAPDFATSKLKNVEIQLSKTSTANVTMQVGALATTVDIAGNSVVIDTTTAQLQSNFDARQIVNLPTIDTWLLGALNLSLLGAGVSSNGGVGEGTGPSVGGQRPMNNNFMIEGVDNNDKTYTGPNAYVPMESTAEFSLLQNQVGAEFGHSSGGQFNIIIKSGANSLHGDIYEYLQNRNLNAVDATFANQGIRSNPRYDYNRLGGTIGGPIKKNKLFYFGSFEYIPWGQESTTSSPVLSPTAAGFALLDQMTNISTNNYAVFKKWVPPAPAASDSTTVNGVKIPIGILPVPGATYINIYTYVGSVDFNISDKDQLRGRYVHNRFDALDNGANLPAFWNIAPQQAYLGSLAEYHSFSPTLTNELRLGYNRYSGRLAIPGGLTFPGLDIFPNIQLDNDLGLQIGPDGPTSRSQNIYQLAVNLNWTRGRHTFKFGFDGRDAIAPQSLIQRQRGDYDYADLNEYLNDLVPSDLAERGLGKTIYYGNQWTTYLYATDTWRVRNNVSLYLGLRWERTTVPTGQALQALNSVADVPGLITFHGPKTGNKNFAPRIGIAYSPGKSGRTSIRAGFGMSYDVIFDSVGTISYPPQLSATYDAEGFPDLFKAPFLAGGGIFPDSLPGGSNLSPADARQNTSAYLPDQKLPYSIQWNIGVQHVFHNDWTLETRYLGTRGVHLIVQNRLNRQSKVSPDFFLPTYLQAPSQAALNALPVTLDQIDARSSYVPAYANAGFDGANISGFMPWGNSVYHGWANQLTKRFSRNFSLIAAYTWSHNIDDSTATHNTTVLTPRPPQDFRNLRAERSNSALDRRQRATVTWVYEPPWLSHSSHWMARNLLGNWRLAGTYIAESGEWVTAQAGADSNLDGDSEGDRTVINSSGNAKLGSGVTALMNSAGATVAYLATNPNARYITTGPGARATSGKNTIEMPGINNSDVSVAKKFHLTEHKYLEFRSDFNNFFNHAQYTAGSINTVQGTGQTANRTFLTPANPAFQQWSQNFSSHSRTVQLAAKVVF